MATEKKSMPMTQAGLIRYFDEEKEGIQLKPVHVVAISIGFVILVKILPLIL